MSNLRRTVKRFAHWILTDCETQSRKRKKKAPSIEALGPEKEPDSAKCDLKVEMSKESTFALDRLKDLSVDYRAQDLYHSIRRLTHRIAALERTKERISKTEYLSQEARERLVEEYEERLNYLRSELKTFEIESEVFLFKRKNDPSFTQLDVHPEKANPFLNLALNKLSKYRPVNYFLPTIILLVIGLVSNAAFGTLLLEGPATGFLESGTLFSLVILIGAFALSDFIYSKYKESFENLREAANVSDQRYLDFVRKSRKRLENRNVFWWTFPIIVVAFTIWTYYVVEYPSSLNVASYLDDKLAATIIESIYSIIWVVVFSLAISVSKHVVSITLIMREFCDLPLLLRPLHPDGAAGLKPLAKLALVMSMAPLLGFVVIGFYVLAINYPIGWRIASTVVLLAVLMVIVFFFPLSRAHSKMANAKTGILANLSRQHDITYTSLVREMNEPSPEPMEETYSALGKIENLYERAENMPVWPFDVSIVAKLATSIFIPMLIIFGGELVVNFTT